MQYIITPRQKTNGTEAIALDGLKKVEANLKKMDKEAKMFESNEIKNEKLLDELKKEEQQLEKEKENTANEYEKSMNEIATIDKNFDIDNYNKEENKPEDRLPEDTDGFKLGEKDLERVLNFYGDMDKPNNDRKIDNQKISDSQRDW